MPEVVVVTCNCPFSFTREKNSMIIKILLSEKKFGHNVLHFITFYTTYTFNNLADYRAEFHNLVQRLESINREHVFIERRGGLVVSALDSAADRAVIRVRALCGALRCVLGQDTLLS